MSKQQCSMCHKAAPQFFEGYRCKPCSEKIAALKSYADSHGRNWKSKLLDDWFSGRCEGELQQVRNQFGPSWLKTFQLNRGH